MSFVGTQAKLYHMGMIQDRRSWKAYADSVVAQWDDIRYPLMEVTTSQPYAHAGALRTAMFARQPLKVWSGGTFVGADCFMWHPLDIDHNGLKIYQISRALHDYKAHYLRKFDFDFHSELGAAQCARLDFPPEAHAAQWTDDVAMSCAREYFGRWPLFQDTRIVRPNWEGLENYLREVQNADICRA